MNAIIEIENLSKVYNRSLFGRRACAALTDCSLRVAAGEVVALLGMNGAGKSTLMKCVLGLVRPSSGMVTLFEAPRGPGEGTVGYLPELLRLPTGMRPSLLLQMLLKCSRMDRGHETDSVDAWLRRLSLSDAGNRGGELSRGMERRVGIAAAMIHRPQALLLDEPSDGLDPEGKRVVRELILEARKQGTGILLSSHLLSEVEQVADRIVVLRRGRVVLDGDLVPDESSDLRTPRSARGKRVEEVFRRHAL